jgi:hypothetical protein
VASSDLGGLGPKDGAPVAYDWALPSLAPLFLPWLAVLVLLTLKPNRRGEAWWIWLPLGCVAGLAMLSSFDDSTFSNLGMFLEVIFAMTFGFAAVWLLSSYLGRSHRILTFLCVLPTLAGFSLLTFMAREGWTPEGGEALQVGILLALGAFAISVALMVSGLLCRSRYRPVGIYLWLFVSLTVVWFVVATPFLVFAMIASGGRIPWVAMFAGGFAMAAVSFAALLPFLVLSSCSPLFRERLKQLLNVSGPALPTMPKTPPPPVTPASP